MLSIKFLSKKNLTSEQKKHNELIRNNAINLRRQISLVTKYDFDHKIYINLKKYLEKNNFKNIAFYWPTEKEVDTIALISELLNNKKYLISLPQVVSKNKMIFRYIDNLEFEHEFFKSIKEPVKKYKKAKIEDIEIIITPLLAYDESKWRLGYGLGYYDRVFQKANKFKKVIKIGLAYTFQKFKTIYHHQLDQKLDLIITELGEY